VFPPLSIRIEPFPLEKNWTFPTLKGSKRFDWASGQRSSPVVAVEWQSTRAAESEHLNLCFRPPPTPTINLFLWASDVSGTTICIDGMTHATLTIKDGDRDDDDVEIELLRGDRRPSANNGWSLSCVCNKDGATDDNTTDDNDGTNAGARTAWTRIGRAALRTGCHPMWSNL
jgi:hypothetical protein